MALSIDVHCKSVSVSYHMPGNSNSITLEIEGEHGENYDLTLYRLPESVTARLIWALRQPDEAPLVATDSNVHALA